jgi:hypothetical protein
MTIRKTPNPFIKAKTVTIADSFRLISRNCLTVLEKIDLTTKKESIYLSSLDYYKIIEDAATKLQITPDELITQIQQPEVSTLPQEAILDVLVKLKNAKDKVDDDEAEYSFYIMGYLLKSRIVREQIQQLEEAYALTLDSVDDYIYLIKQQPEEVFKALMEFFIAEETASSNKTTTASKKKVMK